MPKLEGRILEIYRPYCDAKAAVGSLQSTPYDELAGRISLGAMALRDPAGKAVAYVSRSMPNRLAYEAIALGDSEDTVAATYGKTLAKNAAKAVGNYVDSVLDPLGEFVSTESNRLPNDPDGIITASMLLAALAHHGEKRKNADRDYIVHPMAAAAIAAAALSETKHTAWRRIVSGAMVHDTFERALKNMDSSISDCRIDSFLFSSVSENSVATQAPVVRVFPLMVERLYEKLGRGDGKIASKDLWALTKLKEINGIGMSKDDYKKQWMGRFGTRVIKIADMMANIVDPKPEPQSKLEIEHISETLSKYSVDIEDAKSKTTNMPTLDQRLAEKNIEMILAKAWVTYGEFFARKKVKELLRRYDPTIDLDFGVGTMPFGRGVQIRKPTSENHTQRTAV